MDAAHRGAKALEDKDIPAAIVAYTKALIEHPTSPDYYIQRSTAFTRLKPPRHDLALKDAETAVICAKQRAKRNKIQAAQFRRVVSLYNTGKYVDAKFILQITTQYKEGKEQPSKMEAEMWSTRIENKLEPADAATPVQAKEYPELTLPDSKHIISSLKRQIKSDGSYNYDGEPDGQEDVSTPDIPLTPTTQSVPVASTTASTTPPEIRHEWYQNAQSVIVTLYAKGVPKDKAEVDIQDDSVSISFPHPANPNSAFSFNLDPLFALIDAAGSRYSVMSTKVEFTLKKATPGQRWSNLEGSEPLKKSTNGTDDNAKSAVMSTLQQPKSTGPSYPTSSKSGPKNWDKLADDLTAKKKGKKDGKGSEEDEEDDADSDYGGDAVDGFFKKLYKGADDDTRRAMMKSYQESNGTALSTDWRDVGKRHVDPVEESKDDK